jgi:hypothetical protein
MLEEKKSLKLGCGEKNQILWVLLNNDEIVDNGDDWNLISTKHS